MGTLLAEKVLKANTDFSFLELMVHMRLGEIFTTTVMLTLHSSFRWVEFFKSWDASTICVLLTFIGDAWLSGLMVKRLSAVTKNVCKCCTLSVLYVYALYTGRQVCSLTQALGAVLIIQSTILFGAATNAKNEVDSLEKQLSQGSQAR